MVKKFHAGKKLTEREKQILYLIRTHQYEERYSPTQTQIANTLGVTTPMVYTYVKHLKEKGYLEMSPSKNPIHGRILFPKGTVLPFSKTDELPADIFPEFLIETLAPKEVHGLIQFNADA